MGLMDQFRNKAERLADQAREKMAPSKDAASKEAGPHDGHDSGHQHGEHSHSHEGHEGHGRHEGHPKRGHHHDQ